MLSLACLCELNPQQFNCLLLQVSSALELADGVLHWLIVVKMPDSMCCGLLSILADKTASLWSPFILLNQATKQLEEDVNDFESTKRDQEELLAGKLWKITELLAKESGCNILQMLVDSNDNELLSISQKSDLPYLTELLFYQLDLSGKEKPYQNNVVRSYLKLVEHDDYELLAIGAKLLEASYVESNDCPEVLKGKSGKEVLMGYCRVTQGEHKSQSHILLLAEEGEYRGVMIFKEHNPVAVESKCLWELAYIGLPANYRGKGKGSELLNLGIDYVQKNGGEEIVVAVDRRNYCAIKMYEKNGFKMVHEQALFVKLVE